MTSEREPQRRQFLTANGLGAARREPMTGDASTRAYERLHLPGGATLILMDQAPRLESPPCPPRATPAERAALGFNALYRLAAGRVDAFVACAGWLREQGLSAPAVQAFDASQGFAVIEDLGDNLFAPAIAAGASERELYDAAVDVLVALHSAPAPDRLEAGAARWPLLDYDAVALATATEILIEWLPAFDKRVSFSASAIDDWRALWAPVIARGAAGASVFCHRDFHAENLLWLPERGGVGRVGLIDFQDAVRAHPVWDLSMLLHDARRDVSAALEAAALERYFRARPAIDTQTFIADYHALGALNVVRIIGIFARLVARDGKPRYGAFMPRLWAYLDRCLEAPAPEGLGAWLDAHAPGELRR